jgi:hypothetical protein
MGLQVWSNPHYNTGMMTIVKNNIFVNPRQDYRKSVNLQQDLNPKPVNLF